MKFTQLLSPDTIRHGVLLSSKKRALELAGKIIATKLNSLNQPPQTDSPHADTDSGENGEPTVCEIACFSQLFKRENLGCTGLNNGVALPHAKLPSDAPHSLNAPVAAFLQLDTPIDYESADHKEVDLILAIMIPEGCCEQYRGELQKFSSRLADKTLLKQLRAAHSVEDIWQIFSLADNAAAEE